MPDQAEMRWRTSSYSGYSDCVEVAFLDDRVAVRDSKDRQGAILTFTLREWRAFIAGARDGEFDSQLAE
jgi:hypothetical protein